MFCKNCGETLNENQKVCPACGTQNANATSAPANNDYLAGQDKTKMILLCIFLGGYGVHNFILGETKKGIFKIAMTCCCGISIIFVIMDLIKIIQGTYVIDTEKVC